MATLIRRVHGSDDALKAIGDTRALEALFETEVTREELIGALMDTYCGAAYGDKQWLRHTGGWTTPEVPTVYGDFRENHPDWAQLALDPGFISHLDGFEDFLNKNAHDDPVKAHNTYRSALGTATLWRGMRLTEDEADHVREHGIKSGYLRNVPDTIDPIAELEANIISAYFSQLVEGHFHRQNNRSPLISVSDHADVAVCVAAELPPAKPGFEQREVYLFELAVPEMDRVLYTEHGARMPSMMHNLQDRGAKHTTTFDGVKREHEWDNGVESFVMYAIDAEEIVSVERIEAARYST